MDTGLRRRINYLKEYWYQRLNRRQERWLEKRVPSVSRLQLGQRSIFILPTWQGAIFGLGAIIILIISVAERNPFSILLSASLLSLFLVSLVLCYRNLSGLQLLAPDENPLGSNQRCFLGEQVDFQVAISSSDARRKYHDIWIGFKQDEQCPVNLTDSGSTSAFLTEEPVQRGIFNAPRMILQTRYPAGLWRAWSRPHLQMRCLVYPRPVTCNLPEAKKQERESKPGQQLIARQSGVDDFTGLRNYYPGDSRRRIAWHALARGQGLKTKQFVREDDTPLMLSPAMFAEQDMEKILSCLTYQVIRLIRQDQQKVGLKLPGCKPIEPGAGHAHMHKMLQALALWE